MKSAQILKQKINSGSLTLGAIATLQVWPSLVESAIRSGLDYLIIDLEHNVHSPERVVDTCTLGRMVDFPVLLRPPSAEFTPVRLALDLGPCGLLVPYVEDAAAVDGIRDAVYMKPRGRRRPGGPGNRWVSDYNYETFKAEVEDDLVILPQIESRKGLENVEAIAAHPLTTAIAIGPYDLSADLGVCWQPKAPILVAAQERIRQAGRAAGKQMWHVGDAASLMACGYTFLCIAEPVMLMETAFTQMVMQARSRTAGAAASDAERP